MDDKLIRTVVLQTLEATLELQLRAVRHQLGTEGAAPLTRRRSGRRRASLVDLSYQALVEAGRPMHVKELVQVLLEKHGRVADADTMTSSLGKKVRQGVLMRQTAPATYEALKEEDSK